MKIKRIKSRKLYLYVFLFFLLALVIYYWGRGIRAEDIRLFVAAMGIWAPLVYIILLALTYIIAPISGSPVFFAGFLLFGKIFLFYNYVAFLVGAVANFWVARFLGRGIVVKLVGQKNIVKIDEFTKDYGVKSLIFFRVFQGYLSDFVSYAYGLTNMKFFPYFLVSLVAPFPWLGLWWFLLFPRITSFQEFTFWVIITIIPMYIISAILVVKYKRRSL